MAGERPVLIRPLLTEKSNRLSAEGKYTFRVAQYANKIEIKHAVERTFQVSVTKVNVIRVRGKERRLGRYPRGHTASWKKAIVTVAKGQSIPLFEGT